MEIAGETPMKDRTLYAKIVLYGKAGAGKTALMMRYVYNKFDYELESTIGAAFNSKSIKIDKKTLTLQIWDTAGSERFNSIVPIYLRGAKVVLLCFQEPDLEDIEYRIGKITEINDKANIFLVATKMDLTKDKTYEKIGTYAKEHNYKVFYTSSATGYGVADLFDDAAKTGLNKITEDDVYYTVKLTDVDETKKRCCWS